MTRSTPASIPIARSGGSHLRGQVEAARFVDGTRYEVIEPVTPIAPRARRTRRRSTREALMGERVIVYETTEEGWAWGQLESDGYVGWLSANALEPPGPAPTHKVAALRTLCFPGPDIKLPPLTALPLGARVADCAGRTSASPSPPAGCTCRRCISPRSTPPRRTSSRWPRNSSARPICGAARPRSASTAPGWCRWRCRRRASPARATATCRNRRSAAGSPADLRRGDLVFWKGHVAIARDGETLIHANAHHMTVAVEPVAEAVARIKAAGSDVTSVRRL